jgi:signal transduction histidine kinase
MLSTLWRDPHEPASGDFDLFDVLARQAADLLERNQAEAARRESEERYRRLNEQLEERVRERTSEVRSLFTQLVSAQEEERRRIARDIHDQVGQQLTALRMNLETLRSQAEGRTSLMEQAERTQRLAEDLDQSIDFLTWQLRPAALDHLGLSAALQNLTTGWSERFSVTANLVVDGVEDMRLSRDIEANLYRIAQEALHNVAKHADATQVTLYLTQQNGNLMLLIEDDGHGFDPQADRQADDGNGMGLISMRERAALAGGRLEIESAVGRGTSIYVRIPRSEHDA